MAILALVAGAVLLLALVGGLLHYFGNRAKQAWYVSVVAFVSWFFPFSIVVLVPLDLSSTLYQDCTKEFCKEPFLYVSSDFLVGAWRTIYWCSFALTWVVIPLLQAYTQSGEFTVMKRFRHAVRYNIIYQLIIGSIALLGLVYVSYTQGTSNLRAYVMALSNSWGLVLVVIFMGYGMVDVPRRLWHKGDNARELRRISFKASVVKDTKQDTEDEVLHVAKELSKVCHKMEHSDPLRPFVDKMVKDFPAVRGVQFESRISSPIPNSSSTRTDLASAGGTLGALGLGRNTTGQGAGGRKNSMEAPIPAIVTEKYLADLHARIKRALRMKDRWTAIWHDLLKAGFLVQDIQENVDNPEKKFRSNLRPLTAKPKDWKLTLEWHWHLKLRPILLRSLSALCAILSLLIVWSEMTYNHVNPILSVIGLLVQLASERVSYGAIEAISFFTMLYMCTCAYTTLMKMRLLNNYVLVPNHHTDEPTLLFIGSYLCRLTFPLVYNYLTITAIGKEDSTVFAGYMGKIDMVPFLGGFNYYMPYVILVPTLITLFNVFAKMFAVCSISDNFFDNDDEEGGIGGDLEEGVQVLKDARREEERRLMPDRAGRNRDFTARRGAAFETYNTNKNRNRGDTSSRGMLGEGSSANAWRDVRPHPSGSHSRPYEPYFDESTDDDDSGSVSGGLDPRDSVDQFGAGGRGSFDASSRPASGRAQSRVSVPSNESQGPGPLKSLWQKLVRTKPAIVLDSSNVGRPSLDSDGGRSSIESAGQHDSSTAFGGPRLDRGSPVLHSGPALMFASVQAQPSGYMPSLHGPEDRGRDRDRESLLSPRDPRLSTSRSPSRPHSPQGRPSAAAQSVPSSGRSGSRNSRVFGSLPQSGGNTGDTQRQASPLVNIFDDDD